jgi:hypothetical protein
MEQLLKKKRIYQVEVQPQTLEAWADELELKRTRWGKYFSNEQQFEYFAMLPLSDEQRMVLLKSMIEEAKFEKEIASCSGTWGSSQEHRNRCLPCVLTEKNRDGQPLFT